MAEGGMSGFQPAFLMNGNNEGWGNGWGALVGGAVGGAVGSAWNGNRWNNGGYAPVVPVNNCGGGCHGHGYHDDIFIMDAVSNLRNEVGSVGRDQLMQTAALQNANCQGFSGAVAATERVGAQLAQGQSRTEAAVYTASLQGQIQGKDNLIWNLNASHNAEMQGMRNNFETVSAIKDCCCTTQRSIDSVIRAVENQGCDTRAAIKDCCCTLEKQMHEEGEKTRALTAALDRERLLRESAAKDAKIAQLEAQAFNGAMAAGYAQQGRQDMQSMMAAIISEIRNQGGTGTATPANGAAQG